MSRIGKSPIPVPSSVEVTLSGDHVTVKGPKGTLERTIPGVISIRHEHPRASPSRSPHPPASR